ncbi:hypothetical protein Goshw_027214, partial [Gossypium schwendimanii]|nr:hypothetical protein [Gossypium schwendimanii]
MAEMLSSMDSGSEDKKSS